MRELDTPEWWDKKMTACQLVSRGIKHIWVDDTGAVVAFRYGKYAYFCHDMPEHWTTEQVGNVAMDVAQSICGDDI